MKQDGGVYIGVLEQQIVFCVVLKPLNSLIGTWQIKWLKFQQNRTKCANAISSHKKMYFKVQQGYKVS